MLNNDYVTPQEVLAATTWFRGQCQLFHRWRRSPRSVLWRAVQPRFGASSDITGQGRTVAFGGFGRYYDRVLYNSTLDERFRLQFAVRFVPVLE